MVVAFDWRRSIAFVEFIGTHADCDRVDALTVTLFREDGVMTIHPIRTDADHAAARREIEAAMATDGRTRADLAALIGQSRATEILGRKRALTLPMIRKIARAWRVPERVLVQDYALTGNA